MRRSFSQMLRVVVFSRAGSQSRRRTAQPQEPPSPFFRLEFGVSEVLLCAQFQRRGLVKIHISILKTRQVG